MIILCADDYGLSGGVSRGILELAAAGRLSATSAMVTFDRWEVDAGPLQASRAMIATGLHLNLTLGRPLVAGGPPARHLDANGLFPAIKQLIQRAMLRRLNRASLTEECAAQIERFREGTGTLPDFIDGHQHVHALPQMRDALVDAIGRFTWARPPLVRVPSDRGGATLAGVAADTKRAAVAALARGARRCFADAGLPTNETFGGFSRFTPGSDYGVELQRALRTTSRRHIVMCHPGHVDEELAASGDPLVARRGEELAGILGYAGLADMIWHAEREADGSIDWIKATPA